MALQPDRWVVFLAMLLLTACGEPPAVPFQQQVYVWQRQWLDEHREALRSSRADFATLRVLAGQLHRRAGWSPARVDLAALIGDGRPVVAVIRLDGQLQQLDAIAIKAHIGDIVQRWGASGMQLSGLEIDHDCGTAQLAAYARLLQEVRRSLPAELQLSITALPSWLTSSTLAAVLSATDSSVLQVHAVDRSHPGLIDTARALRWVERYSRIRRHPFYVALPAYGMALVTDAQGRTHVESEVTLAVAGERRELSVDPRAMADFARELRRRELPGLAGLVWFRLPLPDDRRAWPLATLLTVVRGGALATQLQVSIARQGVLHDLRLVNHGTLGAMLPQLIELPARDCTAADAVGAYEVRSTANLLRFHRTRAALLPAGGDQALGWARCGAIDAGAGRVEQ